MVQILGASLMDKTPLQELLEKAAELLGDSYQEDFLSAWYFNKVKYIIYIENRVGAGPAFLWINLYNFEGAM